MAGSQKRFHFNNENLQKQLGPYWLYQIGDLSGASDYYVEKHEQFVYEITLIVSGLGHVRVRDRWYEGKQGSIFIHRINDIHEMCGDKDSGFRYFYLGFDFKGSLSPALTKIKSLFDNEAEAMAESAPGVQDAFLRLFNEVLMHDSFTDLLMESHINDILTHTFRAFSRQKFVTYHAEDERANSEKLVYNVINYIDLEAGSIQKLTDLCDVFGYSYSHIAKRFTAVMGESLQTYFMRRKFEQAADRLRQGLNVTEVSEQMGYQSIHAFSRAFRLKTGMTPSEYKSWAARTQQETESRIL